MHNHLIPKHSNNLDSCLQQGNIAAPNLLAELQQFLKSLTNPLFNKPVTVIVGFSGGLDSTVLLHALHCLLQSSSNEKYITQPKITLKAVHVNHGISPNASDWVEHCVRFCEKLNINFIIEKVTVENTHRQGLEAVARNKRYAVFKQSMELEVEQNHKVVLVTGHHLKDQAETVLHNLTRGAGVNGLAAMPLCKPILNDANTSANGTLQHCRPMLKVNYEELVDYAAALGLTFVVDESNSDVSLTRNMIRHEVLPALEKQWPNIQTSLARTAENMQEALVLLDELAKDDLLKAHHSNVYLALDADWSIARQKNLLRYWLKQYFADIVLSSKHYEWIFNALTETRFSNNSDHCYQLKKAEIRVYKNRVYILKTEPKSYVFNFESVIQLQRFLGDDVNLDSLSKFDNVGNYLFKINEVDFNFNVSLMSYDNLDNELKKTLNKKRMKAFYQLATIPAWERKKWPFLLLNNQVLMLGCHKCSDYKLLEKTLELTVTLHQRNDWIKN